MEAGDAVASVLDRAGVNFAYLFGSRAAGTSRADSDADIAVHLGRELTLLEEVGLSDELGAALHVPAVDLVVLNHAPLELRGRVVQEGRLLWSADESARVAFEVATRSEWFDFRPVLLAHTRRYLRQVAERGLGG